MSIFDVAREAGVSIATVSRVINCSGPVKKATRDHVEATITALGYSVNRHARNLRTSQSNLLLVLVPDISNPFYAGIIKGIEKVASRHSYNLLMGDTGADSQAEKTYFDLLRTRVADGAICLDPESAQQMLDSDTRSLPWVACCEFDRDQQVPYVGIDNAQAAKDAIRFLMDRGRRNIAMIGSDDRFLYSRLRREGYLAAFEESGLTRPSLRIDADDPCFDEGYRQATRLLDTKAQCDAIFAVSDTLAIGAMQAVHAAGLRVPEDVAIVGFDNIPLAAMVCPGLTTVSQPMERLGGTAARLLLERLNDSHSTESGILLRHELVVRQSA